NVGLNAWFAGHGIASAQSPLLYVGNTTAAASSERVARGLEVIDWFLDALPGAACLSPRHIALVVDAIRPQIYGGEPAMQRVRGSYFGQMRSALISRATARHFIVVDLDPVFRSAYKVDGRRFEFSRDNHWNAHGHEVAAAALRGALST